MKAIYFCSSVTDIEWVYPPALQMRLAKEYDFITGVYDKSHLGKTDFSSVEFLFSTWGMPALTEEEIKSCFPALKAVFYGAGTVQAFAAPFLNAGVRVFSAWQANAVPVAEYALAQIILANKGFYQATRRFQDCYKNARTFFENYQGNYDTKIGILGDGAIGSRVIEMLKAYHVDVLVYSITMDEETAKKKGVKLASLEEIFSTCQVISNHLANNPQTVKMINGKLLSSMQDYSTFINTGRGAQVDESALIEVLRNNLTITAVLDVTHPEPPVEGSPLYTLPNVFLTPHSAGSSGNEVARMGEYMLEESKRFVKGEPCPFEVTKEMLRTMA